MSLKPLILISSIWFLSVAFPAGQTVLAQNSVTNTPVGAPTGDKTDIDHKTIEDMIFMSRIREEEKKQTQNKDRVSEFKRLALGLSKGVPRVQPAGAQLARMEKLLKKIRDVAGADGDPEFDGAIPTNESEMLARLSLLAEELDTAINKTSWRVISARTISLTDEALSIVRALRISHPGSS